MSFANEEIVFSLKVFSDEEEFESIPIFSNEELNNINLELRSNHSLQNLRNPKNQLLILH